MSAIPVLQTRCAALRSKSSYGAFGDFHEEMNDVLGSTTTYWCIKTQSKAGPDEHFVHRSVCNQNRRCWEGAEE